MESDKAQQSASKDGKGSKENKDKDNQAKMDPRLRWIYGVTKNHFRTVKIDKFRDFFENETVLKILENFFDNGDARAVYLSQSSSNGLEVGDVPPKPRATPSSNQKKGEEDVQASTLHLLKARGVTSVRPEFCSVDILMGSFDSQNPLEHLEQLSSTVFFPLLNNTANQGNWSEVVRKEVTESIHNFYANLQITGGMVKGETTLPLPPPTAAEGPSLEPREGASGKLTAQQVKEKVHIYEGCLITWTKQIKNVLKLDPEGLLSQKGNQGPTAEIKFWRNKAKHLNSIFDQLQSSEIRKVLRFLDQSKSTYNQPFARLCKEIFQSRAEANDNVRYMAPLEPWFEGLETEPNFLNLPKVFRPMMHLVLLVWKNSNHYNTSARLVVLVREISNALIQQAREFVSGEIIFGLIDGEETEKAVEMIRQVLKVFGQFKSTFFDYKAKANSECPNNPWRVQNVALFMRLDTFLERCHDILDLTETVLQFSKLGKIEIGGTKGKTLSTSVQQVHSDFEDAVHMIKSVNYDVLDVDAKRFDDDFYDFRVKIKELERRLASVLSQGFDDSPTFSGRFKLLDSFDQLLERPIIQDELEKKQMALIVAYGEDLKEVQQVFLENCAHPPISNNLPPIAGALTWVRGLLDRIRLPMEKLRHLKGTILEREGAKEIMKTYTCLCASLLEFENQQIKTWEASIQDSSISKLKLPLVKRSQSTRLLTVNFDPALVRLLREVKYFLLLGLTVPPESLAIYKKAEQFRRETGNLDLIVQTYNRIQTSLLPVERPLIKVHLQRIDKTLNQGLRTLTWKSHGIEPFITESATAVREADEIVNALKENLATVESLLAKWKRNPVFARRAKPVPTSEFQSDLAAIRATHFQAVTEGGKEIHKLLKESVKKLKISAGLPDWKAYLDFVNNILVEGLAEAVCVSLSYLNQQIDPITIEKEDRAPMLEIDLVLNGKLVLFYPTIGQTNKQDGIRDLLDGWINSFFKIAGLFKRLDSPEGSYVKEMQQDPNVQMYVAQVYENMQSTTQAAEDLRASFAKFEYLWASDLNQIFESFLETAYDEVVDEETGEPVGRKVLSLERFDERINHFQKVRSDITEIPPSTNIGFLRVNSQPIKQALSTWVTKWVYLFTQYLHDFIIEKLQSLQTFMTMVHKGLEFEAEGTLAKDDLMHVMQHIRNVRKIMDETHESFGPLRDMLTLLRNHGITFEGEYINGMNIVDFLDSAPDLWDATVNKAFKAKEVIQPAQNQMADSIRKDVGDFATRVSMFRNKFKANAPFGGLDEVASPHDAYVLLDDFSCKLQVINQERSKFAGLEDLFELQARSYEALQDTERELSLLKIAWDTFSLMEYTFSTWKELDWNEISTDTLETEMRYLFKQAQLCLPRETRTWGIYKEIEKRAKNMSVVLPLVNDLHSPAMRDRHWKHLMAITCKQFNINSSFCLSDVLKLELHLFVDDVSDIVEIANKELKIDQNLRQIEDVWQNLSLEYVPHKDTETMILSAPEEVIEFLEEHQLQLQTMASMGKFVEFFKERVTTWNKTLGTVEVVLHLWLMVQKHWQSLETIFLTSADIRSQLPEDTKRFEILDQSFKELMESASKTPNVVQVCGVDGREEVLQEIWKSLEQCQKALNEYLDMKKNIFPRFYFVSNIALLDILSNGNNPEKIMHHMGACFDGIESFSLEEPVDNGTGKTPIADVALAMVAKDGEKVEFPERFKISGAVEHWLNDATGHMQQSLKTILGTAYELAVDWAVDKPRHMWQFDYPAQVVLLGTQVYWTEECEEAIEEIENGQQDAMKNYLAVCNTRLEDLIKLVQGNLTPYERTKTITLITIDVHARDVVSKMATGQIESADSFLWQSQLRYYFRRPSPVAPTTGPTGIGESEAKAAVSVPEPTEGSKDDCDIRICDFQTKYSYEYVGNTGRLVITPLTDRCYITLTMALRLILGGAPAGPAGTGKTETTKDLARSVGLPCYVFNCSDQMNYQTMGDIFKGLAQTGAWGCFDEFNRIPIEVLSVVATQVKTILGAIKHLSNPMNRTPPFNLAPKGSPPCKVGYFDFMGSRVCLVPTTGFFITMNPGYAGRTELPENLKAQFRSCAMIRPDLQPICENMLMAEGFVKASSLSVKFVTLYHLSSELLSPQPHYDWGLRNVKSVLRVAGTLKRAEPDVDEAPILMRALRDFNTPKMPLKDLPIFLRLVSDLFPGLDLPPVLNEKLKTKCISACQKLQLQPDDVFLAKTVNFDDLLQVRHSVMLLGPAGCGKTSIWRLLMAAHNLESKKANCVAEVVNPKSITSDELYGYMTLQKDWKDGALSIIMRNMSKNITPYYEYQKAQWIVLDGDIDAIWIESMNTVMDDNKVLTLVSNERIPLTAPMRMVFEINSLKNATPATVSRAGILYINDIDVGWQPFVDSWIQRRKNEIEVAHLPKLFAMYVGAVLIQIKARKMTYIVPRQSIASVESLCNLLDGLLFKLTSEQKTPENLEQVFVFAMIWAFGGSLSVEKNSDDRKAFSQMWRSEFKRVAFPGEGLVFDYYFDVAKGEMVHWSNQVAAGDLSSTDIGFSSIVIPTTSSVRLSFLLDTLVQFQRPACFVGAAGTGKTTLVKEYLRSIEESFSSKIINMNYYTDSMSLQAQMEQNIDKRSGKIYGPSSGKRLVFFIDDLNMPFVEEYGTQTPIALLRQHIDYNCWFDRADLGLKKEVQDIQYVAAMNHKSGSFNINPRLQRHFSVFACVIPGETDLKTIYASILRFHLERFQENVKALTEHIVDAAIELHSIVAAKFLPTAVKFHYNFNMRDFAAVFQGLRLAKSEYFIQPISMVRLFLHECYRVFADRFVSEKDIAMFDEIIIGVSKKHFEEEQEDMFAQPLAFTGFATQTISDEPSYLPLKTMDELNKSLDRKLEEYNASKPIMNLVLFDDAANHVCRVTRIISNPGGNALLVGVGGSGKQSLSKLAAFICEYDVFQITVTTDFSINDLKENLKDLYRRAGVRPAVPLVFLLTDSQIVDERFLVYVNDLLSSGRIPDLFTKDEYDSILGALRSEAKAAGIPDTPDHMMDYFISRVRSNLHLILCFSPVGDLFRLRARKFPALINCTSVDWFHSWPRDALVKVAGTFLGISDIGNEDIRENVIHHIAEVHLSVTEASLKYREVERRYNYVTPKSFLEMISYYRKLLGEKRQKLQSNISRLETGLETLRKTAIDVGKLQEDLKVTLLKVEERKAATDELLEQMGQQRGEAEAQQEIANKERVRAEKFATEAATIEADAEVELAQAQPALDQAAQAVDCLTKQSLTELKSLGKPPSGVDKVTTCVLMMVKNEKKNFSWDNAKRMMQNIDKFLSSLVSFDAKNIPDEIIERVEPIVSDQDFTYEKLQKKSVAAANMANWVINILRFNSTYKKVKPLMDQLALARESKEQAMSDLERVEQQLKEVQDRLAELQETFMKATKEKSIVEAEAAACQDRLSLAERLVNGLASENDRWELEVEKLSIQRETLVGDTLLASAFGSYIGAFNAELRYHLWHQVWTNDLISREIPLTYNITPLAMLANDASIAEWCMEGLPEDPMSIDNGAIVCACSRWPLIIDPQLQGISWLKNRYDSGSSDAAPEERKSQTSKKKGKKKGKKASTTAGTSEADESLGNENSSNNGKDLKSKQKLVMIQLTHDRWMPKLLQGIQNGSVVIIENLGESIDAVLDPLLSRTAYKKGRQLFITIAGSEVEFDLNFRLILQTKLANPHYKPEVAAQCTLVNFSVTEQGLQDQLLARVVQFEKAELEQQKQELQRAFNQYKIQLIQLEDTLLENLANAPDDILSDVPLIEGLEATKEKAKEVNHALELGKQTEADINTSREAYRPVAAEASMLYFLMIQLCQINHMYQYSLSTFITFFNKAMEKPEPNDDENLRIISLRDALRLTVFTMVSRGLFEVHKDVFLAQLTFNLFRRGIIGSNKSGSPDHHDDDDQDGVDMSAQHHSGSGDYFDLDYFNFLLRSPRKFDDDNEVEWLPDAVWQTVSALGDLEGFDQFPKDLVESAPRFQEWYNHSTPETEKLPLDWRELEKQPFRKLLVVRALRPDRMTVAVKQFVSHILPNGEAFTECDSVFNTYQVLEDSFKDSTPTTPIYFILSPGADVVADVDKLAKREGMEEGVTYHNISLGQGQDIVAMEKLDIGHREGWWVILNNVHLMPRWLATLEKKLDEYAAHGSHEKFRIFLSSDPSPTIPIGILDRCIKLTNEPPTGLKANLKRAFAQFSAEEFENAEPRTRAIIFGLCHFHSVMIERKTYGTIGFNMQYPFSGQDLLACSIVLRNYMEAATSKVPWEDLRYVFGEIMYGGHIVNDFDRIMCNAYLKYFLRDSLLDEMELFPYLSDSDALIASFKAPPPSSYDRYLEYIDDHLHTDTPLAFGLHTNAEIGFRTEKSSYLFTTIQELQPAEESEGGEGQSVQHVAEAMLQDILETYREVVFDIEDLKSMLDNPNPFQNVFLQECERMQRLLQEMVRSLTELSMGFVGALTMSDAMEALMVSLYMDRVADSWAKLAYPSLRPLGGWLSNLQQRINQLQDWVANPLESPICTWISGLFNPSSFLTAIMQVTAQTNGMELDKLVIQTDVLKRSVTDLDSHSRDGAYVHGMFLQGAGWNFTSGILQESQPKEINVAMPVFNCKAVAAEKSDRSGTFSCPVYKTQQRGPTYVFTASLKTKSPPEKWVLAAVVLVMDVV